MALARAAPRLPRQKDCFKKERRESRVLRGSSFVVRASRALDPSFDRSLSLTHLSSLSNEALTWIRSAAPASALSLALRSRSARAAASVSSREAGARRAFVDAPPDADEVVGSRRLRGALLASIPRKSYIERWR